MELLIGGLVLYFVPSVVAMMRGANDHLAGIVVVNLFLGWTLLGWVAALVWAVTARVKPAEERHREEERRRRAAAYVARKMAGKRRHEEKGRDREGEDRREGRRRRRAAAYVARKRAGKRWWNR